jgi:DNA-binding MarR family transcriptional regulator
MRRAKNSRLEIELKAGTRTNSPGKIRLGAYAPEETIGYLIWDTIRTFHRTFQKLVSAHGINFGMWPFLRALWTQDGIGIRELSACVHLSPPTTLKAVIALEQAGLAHRVRDQRDSRKTLVYLTAKGRKLFSRVLPDMRYVNRMAVKGMSDFEQAEVKRLLKHMRANMARQQENDFSRRSRAKWLTQKAGFSISRARARA